MQLRIICIQRTNISILIFLMLMGDNVIFFLITCASRKQGDIFKIICIHHNRASEVYTCNLVYLKHLNLCNKFVKAARKVLTRRVQAFLTVRVY